MKVKLCKLEKGAVILTRPLYEEVFYEDSQSFVDYYYEVKAPNCIAFVLKEESGEVVSMLHLDPYVLCVSGEENRFEKTESEIKCFYVVCVATKKEHRHKGYMARLLAEAEAFCRQINVPFLFLMPANPKIYQPFGYQYCFSRKEFYVNYNDNYRFQGELEVLPSGISVEVLTGCSEKWEEINETLCKLVSFSNQWLFQNTDFYVRRSEEYYVNLLKELAVQKGCIYLFQSEGEIVGYYAQTKEEESNMGCGIDGIQECMLSDTLIQLCNKAKRELPILESDFTTDVIMGKWIGKKDSPLQAVFSQKKRGWITELI